MCSTPGWIDDGPADVSQGRSAALARGSTMRRGRNDSPLKVGRDQASGTREAIAAGHELAAQIGFEVLDCGGNAIDAGVAAGIALAVVESEYVNFAGVAPILIKPAETRDVIAISGLGPWPQRASSAFFQEHHRGEIPAGILRSVVPAAPAAWLAALGRYGTWSFGQVAEGAIRLARDGFAMYPLMSEIIQEFQATLREWPENVVAFLPQGAVPRPGETFRQEDLARTLQYLADEEAAQAHAGRRAGLEAVGDAFYRGDIARQICDFQRDNGGLLEIEDLARFDVQIQPALSAKFGPVEVFACGPWSQGPMLLQQLGMVGAIDLSDLAHNSSAYVHFLTEAIKLSAADREAYFGDPDFIDVPMERLLSPDYLDARRSLIRPDRAWPDMAPPGFIEGSVPYRTDARRGDGAGGFSLDTSYVCAVDRHGNAFSATPSDGSLDAPIVPGLGFAVSTRGEQSWTDPAHPSSVAPGKRPRLTPNPALAIQDGAFVMPFGSPGMDFQTQVMLQTFLNVVVFGMTPQEAVEAPRFASRGFPSSSWPHTYDPAALVVEQGIESKVADELEQLGHVIEPWPTSGLNSYLYCCCACMIHADLVTGVLQPGADPRRPSQALAR